MRRSRPRTLSFEMPRRRNPGVPFAVDVAGWRLGPSAARMRGRAPTAFAVRSIIAVDLTAASARTLARLGTIALQKHGPSSTDLVENVDDACGGPPARRASKDSISRFSAMDLYEIESESAVCLYEEGSSLRRGARETSTCRSSCYSATFRRGGASTEERQATFPTKYFVKFEAL